MSSPHPEQAGSPGNKPSDSISEWSEFEVTRPTKSTETHKNKVRSWFAIIILGAFCFEIASTIFLFHFHPDKIDKVIEITAFIMASTTTLLGNISAYYFGRPRDAGELP